MSDRSASAWFSPFWSRPAFFPSWRPTPARCRCGGEVEGDRSDLIWQFAGLRGCRRRRPGDLIVTAPAYDGLDDGLYYAKRRAVYVYASSKGGISGATWILEMIAAGLFK